MKNLLLTLTIMMMAVSCYAEDTINVQVRFLKGIFACPDGDEIVDWSTKGGNEYEHICKDGTWLNSFKRYEGSINYSKEEYENINVEDIAIEKQKRVDEWIYQVKNPPPYIEPTEADYKQMIDDKMAEINIYSDKITDKVILESIKADFESKVVDIDSKTETIKEVVK